MSRVSFCSSYYHDSSSSKKNEDNKTKPYYTILENCLSYASKPFLIRWLTKHQHGTTRHWNRFTTEQLRDLTRQYILRYGTIQDIQKLENNILFQVHRQNDSTHTQPLSSREKKKTQKQLFQWAAQHLKPGNIVYIFDERYSRSQRRILFIPIKARVLKVSPHYKRVQVRILEYRPWYEAGGWYVYPDQNMTFHFDRTTQKWLREGLTAEVCRSYDEKGQLVYFYLPHTRQYLVTTATTTTST